MILFFETWLPQILGYCEFLSSSTDVTRAWINHDFSHTSITNFDELCAQIFDDLDTDNIELELENYLAENIAVIEALHYFFTAIRSVEKAILQRPNLSDPRNLLQSEEWIELTKAAKTVVNQQAL